MLIIGLCLAIIAIWQHKNIINAVVNLYSYIKGFIQSFIIKKTPKTPLINMEIQTEVPAQSQEIAIQTESIPTITISTQTEPKIKRPKPRMVEMGIQTDYVPSQVREIRVPVIQEVIMPIFIERAPILPQIDIPPAPNYYMGSFGDYRQKNIFWGGAPVYHDHPLLRLALYNMHNKETYQAAVCVDLLEDHMRKRKWNKNSVLRDKLLLMLARYYADDLRFDIAVETFEMVSFYNQVFRAESRYQIGQIYISFLQNCDTDEERQKFTDLAKQNLKEAEELGHRGAAVLHMTYVIISGDLIQYDMMNIVDSHANQITKRMPKFDIKMAKLIEKDIEKNAAKYKDLIITNKGHFSAPRDMSREIEELSRPKIDFQNRFIIKHHSQRLFRATEEDVRKQLYRGLKHASRVR